jgi:LuxR family maltose regulon positive regulatory protein
VSSRRAASSTSRHAAAPASTGLRGARTVAPDPSAGEVERRPLVRRLRDASCASLVLVSAPAGYGKTALLAQWARSFEGSVAWLNLGPDHRDPRRLRDDVRRALADAPAPFLLVMDGADALASREALEVVSALIADLPPGGQVAMGCRVDPDLLLGRRLVEGGLERVTRDDLAFGAEEAEALMAAAGVGLTPEALDGVLARTEGWPAGLRLAALRLGEQSDPSAGVPAFAGDDRLVADYLREAMLDDLPPDTLTFLTRTSVLDRLSGELCDALLEESGSAARLLELERSNLLLVPLDSHGEGYRYHRLLADLLRRELRRREPDLVPVLHRRAGEWAASTGDEEAAVRHAMAAGDTQRAAELVWASFPALFTRGRLGTLQGWLEGFTIDQVAASAPLALASAWCCTETRGDLAAHCLSLAQRAPCPTAEPGAPDPIASGITTLRAALARDGLRQMARDAAEGFRMGTDEGPWRSYCRFLEGAAHHLRGDARRARALLEEGVERAGRVAPSVHALCLAQLALLSLEEGSAVRGLMLARRARAVVEEWGLRAYGSSALVYGACALALARSERIDEARDNVLEARRVLSQTTDASAWFAVEVRVVLAHAGIEIREDAVAREALAEAERHLGQLTDAPGLRDRFEHLSRRIQPMPEADRASLSSITAAETRVLRLLPTHHSFREIGELLFLSRFTVKSHAHSLYRKLGVSSRSEAVERSRELRLLGGPPD